MIAGRDELHGSDWDIEDWNVHRVGNSRIILHSLEETRLITFYLHETDIEAELTSLTDNAERADFLDLRLYYQSPDLSACRDPHYYSTLKEAF